MDAKTEKRYDTIRAELNKAEQEKSELLRWLDKYGSGN
jgi:hypothetical protein